MAIVVTIPEGYMVDARLMAIVRDTLQIECTASRTDGAHAVKLIARRRHLVWSGEVAMSCSDAAPDRIEHAAAILQLVAPRWIHSNDDDARREYQTAVNAIGARMVEEIIEAATAKSLPICPIDATGTWTREVELLDAAVWRGDYIQADGTNQLLLLSRGRTVWSGRIEADEPTPEPADIVKRLAHVWAPAWRLRSFEAWAQYRGLDVHSREARDEYRRIRIEAWKARHALAPGSFYRLIRLVKLS